MRKRIRTVKPEYFDSQTISRLPDRTRGLFLGIILLSDDCGLLEDNPKKIALQLYSWEMCADDEDEDEDDGIVLTEPSLKTQMACPNCGISRLKGVKLGLQDLEALGCIERYEVEGRKYMRVVNFLKHQVVNRPTKTQCPLPDGTPAGISPAEAKAILGGAVPLSQRKTSSEKDSA